MHALVSLMLLKVMGRVVGTEVLLVGQGNSIGHRPWSMALVADGFPGFFHK